MRQLRHSLKNLIFRINIMFFRVIKYLEIHLANLKDTVTLYIFYNFLEYSFKHFYSLIIYIKNVKKNVKLF